MQPGSLLLTSEVELANLMGFKHNTSSFLNGFLDPKYKSIEREG
jgi:hypothetical protein